MKSIIVLMVLYCLYQGHAVKGSNCPNNWIRYSDTGRCYYISNDYASFDVAEKHCESENSKLVSVLTNYDRLILSALLEPERDKCNGYGNCLEFWIGVRDITGDNEWTTAEGEVVDKENQFWVKGYPISNGRCVLMSFEGNRTKGLWKNEYCGRPLKFVCFRNTSCPYGFTYLLEIDQCLYLNLERNTWDDARATCADKAKGAQMLMITDSAKQLAVRKYLEDQFKARTDFTGCVHPDYPGAGNIAWIGGQTEDPSRCNTPFVWKPDGVDKIPFYYTNWYPGLPNCYLNAENCVAIGTSSDFNYRWDDNNCQKKYCSVCEY